MAMFDFMKRLSYIILSLSIAGLSYAGQGQKVNDKIAALERLGPEFTFVVLGDNRSGDSVFKKLISMAMERKPQFIINTGDQIPDPGDREDWREFWEMSRAIDVPYFLTVGNHDVNDAKSEMIYREEVDLPGNELYYSFNAGNSLFIVLDSYLTGEQKRIVGEQYKWLEGVLAGSDKRHKFVFLHHPLYPDKDKGRHFGNSLDRYPGERDRLQGLLERHKVRAVFAGHEHMYLRKRVGSIEHIITGGGGASLYAREEDGGFYHFILVTVKDGKVFCEVIDINGKVRDRFIL